MSHHFFPTRLIAYSANAVIVKLGFSIYRILKQMDARNRAHAVVMAMEKGWIKLRKG